MCVIYCNKTGSKYSHDSIIIGKLTKPDISSNK